ncbi:MAG TPA: hypothetical protein VFX29_00445 [Longimicrobiaceae bacterium]|nr:hypothetical protein [Longimicrobiaceae bacterium]
MSAAAERWLRERLPGAPPRLLEAMAAAVAEASGPEADAAAVPDALAEAALRLYREVLGGTGGRDDALPLLAADALLTHALQAQAELDPTGVADFAARWGGAERLGDLLGSRGAE